MPGTPLPTVSSPEVQVFAEEDDAFSAYNTCLTFERQLATMDKVRLVRLLGYLLLCAPNLSVRSEVAKCINSRNDQSDLTDVGGFFERHVIVPFKKFKGRTPASTSHSSRPSFEETRSQMIVDIKEVPKDHQGAKEQALIRDKWRCVVTRLLHRDAPAHVVDAINASEGRTYRCGTECAHIIPEATFFGVEPKEKDNAKLANSASVLAILSRFHCNIQDFSGPKVHSLTNVMTMEKNVHDGFDLLELYFEATDVPNHYKVKTYLNYPLFGHEEVSFTTPDPEILPLPSSRLLALHATCCQVAQLSGSAEHIERVYRDADEIGVLANDGTSDSLLQYMLLPVGNSATAVRG